MQANYIIPMKKLIKTVVRTFYEPHHVVLTDILLENILLSDSDFCLKMKMLSREFNKLIIKLRDDRIIKSEIKVEVGENNKQNLKNVYFFNFAEVRDIIKYKIFKMTKELEIKKISMDEIFYCDICDKGFSALDAQACMIDYIFKCIFCGNELKEKVIQADDSKIDLKFMLNELNEIIILLKETEKLEIPLLDYFQVLEMKRAKEDNVTETVVEEKEKIAEIINKSPVEVSDEHETFEIVKNEAKIEKKDLDLYITVGGVKKLFCDITEEDKEQMTEEEYEKYFEIYSKQM